MAYIARLKTDGYPYMNFVLETADVIAMLVLFGAVFYLVGSICLQFKRTGVHTAPDGANPEQPE